MAESALKPYAQEMGKELTERRVMSAEAHRRKITDGHIVTRCIKIAQGLEDATVVQVSMLGKLLNKILPDLKAVEVTVSANKAQSMQDIEARARAFGINPDELWGNKTVIEGESAPVQPETDPETDAPSI